MTSFDLEYTLIVELLVRHIVDKEEKIRREPLARFRSKHPIIQLISHEKYLSSWIARPKGYNFRIDKLHKFLLFTRPVALIICVPITLRDIECKFWIRMIALRLGFLIHIGIACLKSEIIRNRKRDKMKIFLGFEYMRYRYRTKNRTPHHFRETPIDHLADLRQDHSDQELELLIRIKMLDILTTFVLIRDTVA